MRLTATIAGTVAGAGAAAATAGPSTASAFNGIPTLFVDGVTGTLVGTIQLQARPAGGSANSWAPLGGAGLTATGAITPGVVAGDCEFRVFCSAFTSGTAPWTLQIAA